MYFDTNNGLKKCQFAEYIRMLELIPGC